MIVCYFGYLGLDETGENSVPNSSRLLSKSKSKQILQIQSQEHTVNVNACCCINAAVNYLPYSYAFARVRYKNQMLLKGSPGSFGVANLSGSMKSDIFPLSWKVS